MGGFNLAFVEGELDVGEQCIASALSMNTNLAFGWGFGGLIKIWLGESEAALEYMGRALRLSPRDPQWYKAEEPGTYILLERWTDKESVDAHFKSPHLTKLLPQLAECAVERFKVTRLTKLA